MTQGNKPEKAPSITRKPDEQPNASERAQLIQALKDKGIKASDVNAIVKAGQTRKQIRDELITLLRGK